MDSAVSVSCSSSTRMVWRFGSAFRLFLCPLSQMIHETAGGQQNQKRKNQHPQQNAAVLFIMKFFLPLAIGFCSHRRSCFRFFTYAVFRMGKSGNCIKKETDSSCAAPVTAGRARRMNDAMPRLGCGVDEGWVSRSGLR